MPTCSHYVPGSFYIVLEKDPLNEDAAGNFQHWHTLMHEYAHLVQDRNTISGIFEFLWRLIRIRAAISALAEHNKGTEIVPPLDLVAKSAFPGYELITILQSPGLAEQGKFKTSSAHWQFRSYASKHSALRHQVVYFINTKTGIEEEYILGSRDIREAYSVAVGELHGQPSPTDEAHFEYLSVSRIMASLLGPVDARQTIAICHWALQSATPASRFFDICALLSENVPPAITLYDTLRNHSLEHGLVDQMDYLGRAVDSCIADLQHSAGPLLDALVLHREHIKRSFERTLDKTRVFPLDTVLSRDNKFSYAEGFDYLTKEEPIPIVDTDDGGSYVFGDDRNSDSAFFLRAMRELVDFLLTGKEKFRACPIFGPCAIGESICRVTPWVKGNKEPLCAYGAAAATLGIPTTYAIRMLK